MNMFSSMDISASGMTAEQTCVQAAAENLSIAHVSRRPEDPMVACHEVRVQEAGALPGLDPGFAALMSGYRGVRGVQAEVETPVARTRLEFDPSHPLANAAGYVAYPDINVLQEMTRMMTAEHGFDANETAYKEARTMLQKALEIGRA